MTKKYHFFKKKKQYFNKKVLGLKKMRIFAI